MFTGPDRLCADMPEGRPVIANVKAKGQRCERHVGLIILQCGLFAPNSGQSQWLCCVAALGKSGFWRRKNGTAINCCRPVKSFVPGRFI
jgi:hypothetical protein